MTTTPPRGGPGGSEAWFRSCYEQVYDDLLRFVQRRAHPSHAEDVVAEVFLVAWRRLSTAHKEALALTAWDGLTSPQAAAVLGISPTAYRLRLSRARRALRAHLHHDTPAASVRAVPEGSQS